MYCGDWRDVLPSLNTDLVDAIVSDPPYGMKWDADSPRFTGGKGSHHKVSPSIVGDDQPFDPSPWLGFPKVVLWGSNHYAQRLPVGTTLVWVKKSEAKFGKFLSDAEIAWSKGGHGVYVFQSIWDGCAREGGENGEHYHPTQKPVRLMEWCIKRLGLAEGDIVLDPYAGSGTTGVACLRAGLQACLIEIHEPYAEQAAKRLERAARDLRNSLSFAEPACTP